MANTSGLFMVLSPQAEFFPHGGELAPRLKSLRGITLAFLDNNKLQPRNAYFDLLGDLLQQREGVATVVHAKKPFFTRPARPEVLTPLIERADAVVTGIGE